jgi:hypothetical protein
VCVGIVIALARAGAAGGGAGCGGKTVDRKHRFLLAIQESRRRLRVNYGRVLPMIGPRRRC